MENTKKTIIGFWGYPNPVVISEYKKKFPFAKWIDLDIDFNLPDLKILPEAYCRIVKNIVNNALFYKDDLIVVLAAIGKEKCDSGWFASQILQDMGIEVVETVFEQYSDVKKPIISSSDLPLRKKVELITNGIIEDYTEDYHYIKPKFGFWGVPPNDLSVLELFPDNTHLYGWTRCVEMGIPADIKQEMYVDKDVPTVFYSQAFCSKAQLAKYLANKYNGLYIDIDDIVSNSVRAKLEAFLRLR